MRLKYVYFYPNGIKITILNTLVAMGRSEEGDDEVKKCLFFVAVVSGVLQSLILGGSASPPFVLGRDRYCWITRKNSVQILLPVVDPFLSMHMVAIWKVGFFLFSWGDEFFT